MQTVVTIKRVFLFILASISCLTLFLAGAVTFVRVGLSDEAAAKLIFARGQRLSGYQISFDSARLAWTSVTAGRLTADNLQIRVDDSSPPVSVVRFVLAFDLASLREGRLRINQLSFQSPQASLPHDLSGNGSEARLPNLLRFVSVANVEITNGTLHQAVAGSQPVTLFTDVNIEAAGISAYRVEMIRLEAKVPGGEQPGALRITANVKQDYRTDPTGAVEVKAYGIAQPFLRYVAAQWGAQFPFADGSFDMVLKADGTAKAFQGSAGFVVRSARLERDMFAKPVTLDEARMSLTVNRQDDKLTADFHEVSGPGFSLSADLESSDLHALDPSFTINLKNADIDLEKIAPLVPLNLLEPADRKRLVSAGLRGRVVLTGGSWSGRVSEAATAPIRGIVFVDAYLDRSAGFIPGFELPISDITGRLRLSSEELLFKGISFTVGASPIVLNGWIVDLKKKPKSDLFLSASAQAADLKPLFESPYLPAGFRNAMGRISDLQGALTVNLDVKGDLSRPSMKGRIALEDFQCKIIGTPLPLHKVSGSLRFRGSGVTSSQLKGEFGDSPFDVAGEVSLDAVNFSGDVKLQPGDLKKMGLIGSGSVHSAVPVHASVKGPLQGVEISCAADLKQNALDFGYVRKRAGTPLSLSLHGVMDKGGVAFDDISLWLEATTISGKASYDQSGVITATFNLPPRGIQTSALTTYMDSALELQSGGRIEGVVAAYMDSAKPQDARVDADLDVSYLTFKVPRMYKRIEGLTGSLRKKGMQTKFSWERGKLGSSVCSGSIALVSHIRPRLDIQMDFSYLDTTDFSAPPHVVSRMTWGEWIAASPVVIFFAKSRGSSEIKATKGKTAYYSFTNFSATFENTTGIVNIPSWRVNFSNGLARGSGSIDVRAGSAKLLTLNFQAEKMRLERLTLSAPDRVKVDGDVYAAGTVDWKVRPNRENHGVYKTGSIEVRILDGSIHRFEILSKIFSLINLGSLLRGRLPDLLTNGLPFQKMSWNMEVFDTKWKIRDMKLLADAARIDATGMYFSTQDRVDFKVNVSPLVGFDTLMSGVFGDLITKDGKILTTTFRVRGSSSAPDVRLEPFDGMRMERGAN